MPATPPPPVTKSEIVIDYEFGAGPIDKPIPKAEVIVPEAIRFLWYPAVDSPNGPRVAVAGYRLVFRAEESLPLGQYAQDSEAGGPRSRGLATSNARPLRSDRYIEFPASYSRIAEAPDEATLTRYRREHVGFVFQFYNLIPSLTVRENVQLVTDIARDPMDIGEAIAMVGLTERADHFPAQLSGGEQQRVAIARAIVKRPDVLLCDEPTGALDVQTGKLVLQAIARINRELGTTAIVITHNAAIAAMADRVIVLGDGRIQREDVNVHKLDPSELVW